MRLLLSENLPLRTSGALGDFAEDFVLAQRFGKLGRFKLDRINATTFFAADNAMMIDDAFVDNQKVVGWRAKTDTDGNGKLWTVVEFGAPVPDGSVASATGSGKRHPTTGELIENPADIIVEIMRLAGREDRWWDQLRAEAAAEGLRLAGSLDEVLTIQAWIDRIAKSAGAIWAPGMARLYPLAIVDGYVKTLVNARVENIVARATLENTADVLRLYYDPDKASGKSGHYIELTANPQRYGGVATEIELEWLRSPANAEAIGGRVLPWLAGERYDVEFDCGDESVEPGQWVRLVGHPEWIYDGETATIMVLSVVGRKGSRTRACTGHALVTAPEVSVTAHSIGIAATREAGADLVVRDGLAYITVTDSSDRPIPGATVNVDGGPAKKTDAKGLVTFPAVAGSGEHKVAMAAPGKRARIITMTF